MEKRKRQIDTVLDELKSGIKAVFSSDLYTQYLSTMARFHSYSVNNILLIAMQRPDATLVASLKTWNSMKRYVKKGEKGIRILVPTPVKIRKDDEENEEKLLMRFKVGHVFDLAQTDGEPLPSLGIHELNQDCNRYQDILNAVIRIAPVPVRFDEISGSAKGYFSPNSEEIVIRKGMGELQTVKTAIHELCHSILHNKERMKEKKKSRETMEVEAESCAFVILKALDETMDTSEYSFGYVASWSGGREMKELMASLNTIRDTSREILEQIEDQLEVKEATA